MLASQFFVSRSAISLRHTGFTVGIGQPAFKYLNTFSVCNLLMAPSRIITDDKSFFAGINYWFSAVLGIACKPHQRFSVVYKSLKRAMSVFDRKNIC